MVEQKNGEAQRTPFKESPLGRFAVGQLNGISYKNPLDREGTPIALREKVGDSYPKYEEFVLRRILFLSLRGKSTRSHLRVIVGMEDDAVRLGKLKADLIPEIIRRAEAIYGDWMVEKKLIECENALGFSRRGTDPHVFLGDSSHRKGHGYVQSDRES